MGYKEVQQGPAKGTIDKCVGQSNHATKCNGCGAAHRECESVNRPYPGCPYVTDTYRSPTGIWAGGDPYVYRKQKPHGPQRGK